MLALSSGLQKPFRTSRTILKSQTPPAPTSPAEKSPNRRTWPVAFGYSLLHPSRLSSCACEAKKAVMMLLASSTPRHPSALGRVESGWSRRGCRGHCTGVVPSRVTASAGCKLQWSARSWTSMRLLGRGVSCACVSESRGVARGGRRVFTARDRVDHDVAPLKTRARCCWYGELGRMLAPFGAMHTISLSVNPDDYSLRLAQCSTTFIRSRLYRPGLHQAVPIEVDIEAARSCIGPGAQAHGGAVFDAEELVGEVAVCSYHLCPSLCHRCAG